jgi:3D (Asp-Asp-Asp) domain-containing protein
MRLFSSPYPVGARFALTLAFTLPLLSTVIIPHKLSAQTKGTGHWTLYHIAELEEDEPPGAYPAGTVIMLDGSKIPYRVTSAEDRKIEMQATAQAYTPELQRVAVFARVKKGLWQELPEGTYGWGNRENYKSPFRIVAADQTQHRFGSRVFRPDLVDYVTPDGMKHDGYFWVGDTGGRIKGRLRFDLFAGGEKAYAQAMQDGLGKKDIYCEVDRLPDTPKGWDPRSTSGITRILEALGWNIESGASSMRAQKTNQHSGQSFAQSLREFQEQHPQIPRAEYSTTRGAVTLWFLTQAALAKAAGEDYPVTASARTPGDVLRRLLNRNDEEDH